MKRHDIVVVGASAGGVDALRRLVARLPADLAAAVFVVVHSAPRARSWLPEILSAAGPLPAVGAVDGMPIEPGRIVVAQPDRHLLLQDGHVSVVRGPRENRHRPAIDPLFRSAAWAFGPRVVAVVLTGELDDGVAGLWAVKSCGGTTIVQDPADAAHPQMPMEALAHNRVDRRLPLDGIAAAIVELSRQPPPGPAPQPPPAMAAELRALHGGLGIEAMPRLGEPSAFTCPSCHGALWELDDGELRYRCHTGHSFSPEALLAEQSEDLERSLYSALRTVNEKASALRRLSEGWATGLVDLKARYERHADEMDRTGVVLRALLAGADPAPDAPQDTAAATPADPAS